MTDFEALKRQAKEREEGVRKVFVNYDHDKSDSIDMMELTCLRTATSRARRTSTK